MIDNKTQRLQLPLPNPANNLQDDVLRLIDSFETLDEKVATVGTDGKIPLDQIPVGELPSGEPAETFLVDSLLAMLALDAKQGDIAIRSDVSKSFILATAPSSVASNWKELVSDALNQLDAETGATKVRASSGLTVQQELDNFNVKLDAIPTETFLVVDQAAMLALDAKQGDIAIRSDVSKSFILKIVPAAEIGNWEELLNDGYKLTKDAITKVSGSLSATSAETPVPSHSDPDLGPSLNAQAQALLNRQEKIKGDQAPKNTLFGSYNPPMPLASERLKIIAGGNTEFPGKFFVITLGGGGHGVITEMVTGNVAAPSLPSNSENENWELWRTGTINAIECAYVYKTPATVSGVWSDSKIVESAININSMFGFGAYKAIKCKTSSVSAAGGNSGSKASLPFQVQRSGKFTVAFMGTATAPVAQQIMLDGALLATVNLRTTNPSLLVFEFRTSPGSHVVEITHEQASTNLNVIGVNFWELSELMHWDLDISAWAAYTASPGYVNNRGANEYAIKSANSGNWAGSYHGGETARQAAEFGLDHRKISISDSLLAIGRSFSILQQTRLNWTGGESMNIDSLTVIGDAYAFMQGCANNVNVVASTAYLGMATPSPAFDSAFGTKFFGDATTSGANYEMGPCQQATQIERGTGRLFFSEFSVPPLLANSFGGMTVSYAEGAYAKIYPGFVRNVNTQLPPEFSWSNIRRVA